MLPQINVCPKLWDDIKFLRKKTHNKELESTFHEDEESTDGVKVYAIPILKAIANYILQANGTEMDNLSNKYDRQPFLTNGWTIFKMRYAFDNRGTSSGLRIFYCRSGDNFLLVFVNLKTYCADERALEKEVMARITQFLCA